MARLRGWQGYKTCARCGKRYWARSGSSKYCNECRTEMSVCPVCGRKKSIYHMFCSNTCASKWKYQHSQRVKEALQKGLEVAHKNKAWKKSPVIQKGEPHLWARGKSNPNWKGGSHNERHTAMCRVEYQNWRNAVFGRDNYTCQLCGKRGGDLEAHHIQHWSEYPDLRYSVDNGLTLCKLCHKQLHSVRV